MSLSDGIGTTVHIGGIVAYDAAASSLTSGQTWVEIKEVESINEIGITQADISFTSLSAGKVRHRPGATDFGSYQIVCGKLPRDPGQVDAMEAARTRKHYAVKITEADAPDDNDTDTTHYLVVSFGSDKVSPGASNSVNKRTFNMMVNDWHEVPSAAVV